MREGKLPEMVERVRNALLVSLRSAVSHDPSAEAACAQAARAAILALKTPSDDMLQAMNDAVYRHHEPPEGAYSAAISAALGEVAGTVKAE